MTATKADLEQRIARLEAALAKVRALADGVPTGDVGGAYRALGAISETVRQALAEDSTQ